jgi:cytochrome c1
MKWRRNQLCPKLVADVLGFASETASMCRLAPCLSQNEVVRIPKVDIEARQQSPQSLMPQGQVEKLTDAEVRDLIAYLAGPGQVPLPR